MALTLLAIILMPHYCIDDSTGDSIGDSIDDFICDSTDLCKQCPWHYPTSGPQDQMLMDIDWRCRHYDCTLRMQQSLPRAKGDGLPDCQGDGLHT